MNILPVLIMIAYLCVIIYVVLLFVRLVRAVERIARKIESSFKT